ncbi:MAG: DNA replication/repair protein RecF [Pseudomonadota bacterium]
MTALTRLSLTDFRNYSSLTLPLDGRHICLYGANGSGKTNLLEAVSQLGPGRGLRSASLPQMVRNGAAGGWTISAMLNDERRIGVALDRAGQGGAAKRTIRIDGETASAGDLAEMIRIVWLTPSMDGVFSGGASDRRRFFDRQVMAHIPSHGRAASHYEKAMRDRNALLERPHVDPAWADAIEARMAEAGAEISLNRARVLARLQYAIDQRSDGHFPKADISLTGPEASIAEADATHQDVAASITDALLDSRYRDKAAGRTLVGPHRADLVTIHRPTNAPAAQCSTGQQKALLIGLILASSKALADRPDNPGPLLLLDEAAAHLDADRRAALFDELCTLGGQAWLTGTEAFLFEAFGDRAQRVIVSEGQAELA